MQFDSFSEFLAMGGHGLYVWLCYAVGLFIFVILFSFPRIKQKQIIKELSMKASRPINQTQSFGVVDIDADTHTKTE